MIEEFTRISEANDFRGFAVTLSTVLLPVFLMLLKVFADVSLNADNGVRARLRFRSRGCGVDHSDHRRRRRIQVNTRHE
ncbi:GntP family permease [Burkholderia territorii]|uniref:GntP family permease n=1 Tax=Burkholderia territorii TaxID=1503055 RepID=UPI000A77D2ED|nr:GntP family permease [Burkholderia territorii]